PALYRHIWQGEYYEQSYAQVFAGKYEIKDFEPQASWDGPYFGVDWGFSLDPTAGVKCWINDGLLYIEYDFAQVGLELDDTAPALINALPDIDRNVARADNARPESISYVKRNGISRITACEKGKGSVEDGIQFIKSFKKVIIHPRCEQTAKEFDLYSYKVDRLSGDILTVLVDDNNHIIDALRYALEPV
ncbi:terminase large subunit, partial [Cutibacterium acnes]